MASKTLTYYKGDYNTFEETRAEHILQQQREADSIDMKRKHMQTFIDKFRFNAKRASLVRHTTNTHPAMIENA